MEMVGASSFFSVYLGKLLNLYTFFFSISDFILICLDNLLLMIFIISIMKYLGAYDDEEAAARAYDLAALKYWGPGTLINFPVREI